MKKHLLYITCLITSITTLHAQTRSGDKKTEKDSVKNEKKQSKTLIQVDSLTYQPNNITVSKTDTLELIEEQGTIVSKSTPINVVNNYRLPAPIPIDAGRTSSSIDVSPTGAATYTIPIAVPPGINGVMPQVALSYNSQGGNGLAGYGWNVTGISTITRIAATQFHDGFVGRINFDMNDRFALDGQRLILKSGIYGADGAEYETENYSNLKIISRGTYSELLNRVLGPAYFEVIYPDGSKYLYGFNYSSSRDPRNYPLAQSESPLGLKIFYEYMTDNNSIYISKIKYGGATEPLCLNTISFLYKDRQRTEQVFVGDLNFFSAKILTEINVIGASFTGYRNYILTHNTIEPLKYERLTSVQEFSGDKTRGFEPITFNYANTANLVVERTSGKLDYSGYSATNTEVLTSDFTGDGKLDFIIYPTKTWERNFVRLYYGNEIGGSSYGGVAIPQMGISVNTGLFKEIFPVTWLTHTSKILAGQGLVLVKNINKSTVNFEILSTSLTQPLIQQYVKVWDNIPLTPPYENIPPCTANPLFGSKAIEKTYLSGDFNGDGLTDILAINKAYQIQIQNNDPNCDPTVRGGCCSAISQMIYKSKVYFINLDRRLTTNFVNDAGFLSVFNGEGDKITTGDFDGDGKTDIYHFKNGQVYIYTLNAQNNIQLLCQQSDSRINLTNQPLLGDYNGDGKTDFLFPTGLNNSLFASFISTGKRFKKEENNMLFYSGDQVWDGNTGTMTSNHLIANDMNGDGKTDIIKYFTITKNGTTTGTFSVRVYPNMGSANQYAAPWFGMGPGFGKSINLIHYPIPVFLSSDKPNWGLEFGVLSDNSVSLFGFTKDVKKESLIGSVVQDGVNHTIEYADLVPSTSGFSEIQLYKSAYTQNFPFTDIALAPGLKVVSKLKRNFGANTLQQIFGYRNAVSNSLGLGFMGFGQFIKSNWHTGFGDVNKVFSINITDPLNRGAAIKLFSSKNSEIDESIIANPNAGTLFDFINRTDYTYSTQLLPNKVYKSTISNVSSRDLLNNTNTTITYQYDNNNNLTKELSNFNGQGTKTVDVTYANSLNGNYFVGRPLTKTTTLINGADVFSTEEQYSYTGYLLTKIKKKGNNTSFITDSMQYDVFGNVLQKITIAPSGAQRVIKMAYDPTGRFMTKATDVESLETYYEFDNVNGNLKKKINPYNLSTNYDYDNWGRLGFTADELGNITGKWLNKWGSNIEIEEWTEAGFEKRTLVNALGQTLQEKVMDVFGVWKYKAFQYDVYDRLVKESETSLDSTTYTQWNTTDYDNFGRVKNITTYTGKTTTITYDGLKTTVNDGTKTTITTKNALGQVTETTDPGGTIKNTYYANGNLKTADYAGSVQSIEYDGWGRKTKLTDPSAGVYTYTYNDFGETTKETTPKGITTFSYDANGKLIGKVITGSGTNMTYQYIYNSDKLLAALNLTNADGNNTTYTYSYDEKKRPLSTIESNPYATFTKTFSYDMYGRLNTEQSTALNKANNKTATKTVKNNYQNGQLLNITDNGTGIKIWEVTAVNARGQVTQATLGNAITQTNLYDQYGLPQEIKTNRIGVSPAQLLKLNYNFNALTGNLNSRSNSAFNYNETFTYDNLDRLTKTDILENGIAKPSQSQTYDPQGRTTSHSDLGTFTYNGYQQTGLKDLKPTAATYYQNRPTQQISYNAFKSPVQIYEAGKDRISFLYNSGLDRSTMFYGGEQTDPLQRRYRRHYSEDGSMEITNDRNVDVTAFTFYLGGDAYTAPAIWKEEFHIPSGQSRRNLYYLHRDYQGTILQITNATGQIQENRLFDAWGNVLKITDAANNIVANFIIT
ncbi:MAG: hypothetical protein EAZ64_05515, partial [Sphingobacteriales bacterium]